MEIFTKAFYIKCKFLIYLLSIGIVFNFNETMSQDLFGLIPNIPTSYVTKTKNSSTGDIFVTVWGGGVYKSGNGGETWTLVSTGLNDFYLTDIEFLNSSEAMVATIGGGIYKTTSMTNINWKPVNTGLTNLNVKTLKLYPNGWILAGTYGSGVFLSKDKGNNWVQMSKGLLYRDITSIEVADNGWILAGTYGGGIYQSRDTAKTWSRQNSGMKNLFINDLKRSPNDYIYAATNGRGVYMSVNDGIVWTELDTFMTRPLKLSPVPLPDLNTTCITFNKNKSPVFGSRYGGIYAEDLDEDYTWVPSNIRGIGVNSLSNYKNNMYAVFPFKDPYKTDGVGDVWAAAKGETITQLGLAPKLFSPKLNELILYYKNFVKVSNDDGRTWSIVGSTPANINKIARDSTGDYYAATEKGLYKSNSTLSAWSLVKCLDTNVFDVEISSRGSIFIITQYFNQPPPPSEPIDVRIAWFTTDKINWQKAPITFDKKEAPPTEVAINYNANVYIASNKSVYFSTNNGLNWANTLPFGGDVQGIGFLTDNTVILGTAGAGLWRSTSAGSFERIWEYPARVITNVYTTRENVIYTTGTNIFVDDAYGMYESTYMSLDSGRSFININNNFNTELIMSFCSNNSNDFYMSTQSGMLYRTIAPKNLTTPKLLTIPDKAVNVDTNSLFSWTSDKRAELYQLEIAYNDDFSYIWESVTLSDTVYNNWIELASNHKYYWRVRSKNHSSVSDWSVVRTFISKMSRPVLHLPENNATNVPVYPVLKWYVVDGATKYKIQLSEKSDFSNIAFEWESTDTSSKAPLLKGLTKYYWRVMAMNETAFSNYSLPYAFETVFGPPQLLSPANKSFGNSITPNLTWEKAKNIDVYDIQLSDKSDFSNIMFEKLSVSSLSQISDMLEYDKVYYWRVRSRNGEIISEWSLIWEFLTGYSPVKLLTPEDNSVNIAIKTDYTWEKHNSQNKYEIEISTKIDFVNLADKSTIDGNTNYTTTKLQPYQEYYWRSRVVSDVNTGLWSVPFKYKTKVAQISLRYPDNNSVEHPISIRFLWYQTTGATTYHLQIANDSEFNDLIFSQDTIVNTAHTFSQLNPGTDYYWRVRAVTPEGVGDWSEIWSFTTGSNIPVLLAPENEKPNVVTPVKFEWGAVGGAIRYELQVSETVNFIEYALKKENITDLLYIDNTLTFPKQYYWRVRAITKEGTSNWSQTWKFNTVDPASVDEVLKLSDSRFYPNPANDVINIDISNLDINSFELNIVDLSGHNVFSRNFSNQLGIIPVDCRSLSNGVYFIKIITNNKIYQGEIQVSR